MSGNPYHSMYDAVLAAVPADESEGVVAIARRAGVGEPTARRHLAIAVARGEVVRTGHPNVRYLYQRVAFGNHRVASGQDALDPSGWTSWTTLSGTTHATVVVTERARRAMSPRQVRDLQRGSEMVARAFEPDEPASYVDVGVVG